jgi:hypothetical protein
MRRALVALLFAPRFAAWCANPNAPEYKRRRAPAPNGQPAERVAA